MAASIVTGTVDESRSTLFVRNLPYSATQEQLEQVFSEVGPVKKSFVVTEIGVSEKCRGFGYVTFALREDAEKALKARLFLAKRKLFTCYSRRKAPRKQRKAKGGEDGEDGGEKGEKTTQGDDPVEAAAPTRTANSIGDRLGGGKGTVKQRPSGEADEKKGRLIIRNLAFNCTEKRLRKAFAPFGDIAEVHIPADPRDPGKVRGYGFVQFSGVESAAKAVKEMNAKEINGRPIAVDWSLSKISFLAAAREAAIPAGNSREEDSDDESGVESSSEVEDEDDEDDDDQADEDDEDDDDQEDEDEDEDEDEFSSEDEGVASNEDKKRTRTREPEKKAAQERKTPSDVDQGRTVFIRNILFETTEDEIGALFTQFGEVVYTKLVVDKATEHSKGTAFVKFATREGVERCLDKAKSLDEGGLVLGGRQLLVSPALQRDEASKLRELKKEKQKVEKKDKRNVYLLQEGFIRPGTKAAEGMTDSDLAKRTKLESIKRLKLKNINVFVSPTRLAVHNLPKAVDGKKLRGALLKAAGDKRAKVIESRVMRDMKTPTPEGQSKSLGFAFAEFTTHEHALAALRAMNNSTEYFDGSKRPIVGFSLENRLALESKQRRQARSLFKARQIRSMQMAKEAQSTDKAAGHKPPSKAKGPATTWPKKGALPPAPSSKLERRMQSKSKMTVHVGAKKRWRDRGKADEAQKEKRRTRRKHLLVDSGRKQREPAKPRGKQGESGMQKSRRQKGKGEEAKFDDLVASYKRKLFNRGEPGSAPKKSKWFEG